MGFHQLEVLQGQQQNLGSATSSQDMRSADVPCIRPDAHLCEHPEGKMGMLFTQQRTETSYKKAGCLKGSMQLTCLIRLQLEAANGPVAPQQIDDSHKGRLRHNDFRLGSTVISRQGLLLPCIACTA